MRRTLRERSFFRHLAVCRMLGRRCEAPRPDAPCIGYNAVYVGGGALPPEKTDLIYSPPLAANSARLLLGRRRDCPRRFARLKLLALASNFAEPRFIWCERFNRKGSQTAQSAVWDLANSARLLGKLKTCGRISRPQVYCLRCYGCKMRGAPLHAHIYALRQRRVLSESSAVTRPRLFIQVR